MERDGGQLKWTSVAYGNDKYVALADSYDKRLVVTSEDGAVIPLAIS